MNDLNSDELKDTWNCNILKVRDDPMPLFIKKEEDRFVVKQEDGSSVSWLSNNICGIAEIRKRIEPWLTSLFQSEHLSLLVGCGLTIAIEKLATGKVSSSMAYPILSSKYKDKINKAATEQAKLMKRGKPNIEDIIRVLNDLLKGLRILDYEEDCKELASELNNILFDFIESIEDSENKVATADNLLREQAFNTLVIFLMSFASRTGTRDRLNIFTTNYDRLLEAGAELAGIHFLDRFVGSLSPIFRSSRLDLDMHYNPPGIRGEPRYLEGVVRFTKLHGSIDWIESNRDIRRIGLPFGAKNIKSFLQVPGLIHQDCSQVLIYPNASKDRETTDYPYVELFRDFASALCRPNSTIVTYGYGFGDDHINRIIRDMLTIPSTHLVIIAFSDADGKIKHFYESLSKGAQISLVIGKDLADISILTNHFLPKPSIDKNTIRMGDILKRRYGGQENSEEEYTNNKNEIKQEGVDK